MRRKPASTLLMLPSRQSRKRAADASTAKGMSLRTVVFKMVMGNTRAATPTMSNVLKILLPTTFPTAKSGVPLRAETKLTQNSGIEVPMATIVNPITICDTFIRSASETAPSVRRSAPHKTSTTPAKTKKTLSQMLSEKPPIAAQKT